MARRRRSRVALAALACGLVVGTAACSSEPETPPAPLPPTSPTSPDKQPVVVNAVEPRRAMLPADVSDEYGERIASLLFRGLLRYDARGRLVNEVAESVTQETPTLYRVRLGKGRVFGTGEPVTSVSFVDAWNYAADPAHDQLRAAEFAGIAGFATMRGLPEPTTEAEHPSAPGSSSPTSPAPSSPAGSAPTPPAASASAGPRPTTLSGLRVVDDQEFTVRLAVPDAGFRDRLARVAFAPLPTTAFKDPAAFAQAPVGNGPYQLAGGWLPGKEIRLIPNASYSGGDPARNGGVTFRFFPDPGTTYAALQAGRVDMLDGMPLTALDRYKADLGFRASNQSVGAATSLVFPMNQPRWSGPDGLLLRKAISRVVDRKALSDGLFAGTRAPAGDLAAPVVDGYAPDLCGELCRPDAAAARALLATVGEPIEPLSIAYGADGGGRPVVEALCSAIVAGLAIPCSPTPVASQAALERTAGRHELTVPMLSTRRMARPDLGGFLAPRFVAGSSRNLSAYAAPPAQDLLAKAAQTGDDARRGEHYRRAEEAILADLPEVPLWYVNATVGAAATLQPVKIDVFGVPIYTELARS